MQVYIKHLTSYVHESSEDSLEPGSVSSRRPADSILVWTIGHKRSNSWRTRSRSSCSSRASAANEGNGPDSYPMPPSGGTSGIGFGIAEAFDLGTEEEQGRLADQTGVAGLLATSDAVIDEAALVAEETVSSEPGPAIETDEA